MSDQESDEHDPEQREDGGWRDDFWTATGFPKVFYLRYWLYATYFPLWALGEYRDAITS